MIFKSVVFVVPFQESWIFLRVHDNKTESKLVGG